MTLQDYYEAVPFAVHELCGQALNSKLTCTASTAKDKD